LAYLDIIYRAAEVQLPSLANTSSETPAEERDYSFFATHLNTEKVFEALSPYLKTQELTRPQSEDPRELYDFLFTTVSQSFSERLHNIHFNVRLAQKLARFLFEGELSLRAIIGDLPPEALTVYNHGREQERQEKHLIENYTVHACTPIRELIVQLEQIKAEKDI